MSRRGHSMSTWFSGWLSDRRNMTKWDYISRETNLVLTRQYRDRIGCVVFAHEWRTKGITGILYLQRGAKGASGPHAG